MLHFGVLLVVYAIVSSILVNLIMLIKFLSRAQHAGPAIGEFLSMLFFSVLKDPYRELLIKDGIEPTIIDEPLHRVNIILVFTELGGLALVVLGFLTAD